MITVNKRSNKNGEIISVGVNRGVICKSGANFTKYRGTLAKKLVYRRIQIAYKIKMMAEILLFISCKDIYNTLF